ncbi:baculoviral IAP repeat-containing protein 8-like [Penaeus monodon]|uniref:baculoviral IAP repeat-containing protein 8-like n=1 Tax=Penaeus monodon TaxID=6687 RepID=UPI0018A78459|nr:baculoviral IAP repeat-containing protein 8-like [Penaeus monodon]
MFVVSCGKGLHNWMNGDIPWNEHARWYPECRFVLLMKGQDFINKIQQEYPTYTRIANTVYSVPTSSFEKQLAVLRRCDPYPIRIWIYFMSLDMPRVYWEWDFLHRMGDTRGETIENQVTDIHSEMTDYEPSFGETHISSSISQQHSSVFPSTSETTENQITSVQSSNSEITEFEPSSGETRILSSIYQQQAPVFPSTYWTSIEDIENSTEAEARHILQKHDPSLKSKPLDWDYQIMNIILPPSINITDI